ncbi:MAG TPA: sugar phosphate isomerase/epimerase family protein [Verrucomicrobiota bacterium]|nr:sugar phosphate isomerase [Verrucomicrobiales bacterium]HRI12338.1 sugar phosphate isomerase/epimerase family protein [Verrucomicrobiota bacterium]
MIRSAVTVCLVPEARRGPFVFHGDLAGACASAAAHGFDGIEVFPPHADDVDAMELRELMRQHGLTLAAMGTGAGWLLRKLSLTDPDPHVRMCARDFIGAVVDFAGGFGAPAIVGSMQGRVKDDVDREQALDWLREELDQLGPRAHALNVPLLYEPLNRYETNLFNTVADSITFLQTLRTRNVKLLVDLFHANLEEADIAATIRDARACVGHVHFADSNRRAMGFGHLDGAPIASALRETSYDGFVSAEVLPLPDSESAARQTIASFRRWFPRG